MELHRLVHVQRQLAPAPHAARPGSSPLSSAGPEAAPLPTFISTPAAVSPWALGANPQPSNHKPDIQHQMPEAAGSLQPDWVNRQLHPKLMLQGTEASTLGLLQAAGAANCPSSYPAGTQLLGTPLGFTSRRLQELGVMRSMHASSVMPTAWQQAGAQLGATHGFQQEGLAAPALVGPSLPAAIQGLTRAPWPQLAPWPLQQSLQQGSGKGPGSPGGPLIAWPCSRPCDPMAAWYRNNYSSRPGFKSPLPLGPAATGDFLTGIAFQPWISTVCIEGHSPAALMNLLM